MCNCLFSQDSWFGVPQVYVDQLSCEDMEFIADSIFPVIDDHIICKMVQFNSQVGILCS